MTELLALGSALAFGSGDFLGGAAGRSAAPIKVTAVMHVVSLAVTVVLLVAMSPADPSAADMLWGAAGGLFGLAGGFALITAPPGARCRGRTDHRGALRRHPGRLRSRHRRAARDRDLGRRGDRAGGHRHRLRCRRPVRPIGRRRARSSLAAGLGFGFFFHPLLAQTSPDSGMWPVLGARLASVPVVLLVAWRMGDQLGRPGAPHRRRRRNPRHRRQRPGPGRRPAGPPTVASNAVGAVPGGDRVIARFALHERMSPLQRTGVLLTGSPRWR